MVQRIECCGDATSGDSFENQFRAKFCAERCIFRFLSLELCKKEWIPGVIEIFDKNIFLLWIRKRKVEANPLKGARRLLGGVKHRSLVLRRHISVGHIHPLSINYTTLPPFPIQKPALPTKVPSYRGEQENGVHTNGRIRTSVKKRNVP